MMIRPRGLIVALAAASAAALLFAAAVARALTLDPLPAGASLDAAAPPPTAETPAADVKPTVPSEAPLSRDDIALAVDNDPFLPDRSRPAPYRLPGEDVAAPVTAPELPPAPEFRVTGTIVTDGGSVAVIQVGDTPPRVLGLGESLVGYRLESVGPTGATMVGTDRTLELALEAGTTRPSGRATGRSGNTQGMFNADVMEALQRRFGEGFATILQRAQQSGAGEAQLQALMRQMTGQAGGQGGMAGRGNVRIRRDTMELRLPTPDNR